MGSYLSIPSYSRNTVTLEPIVKKADTEAVQAVVSSAPSNLQNFTKVLESTNLIATNQVEVYIKGEKKEPKEEKSLVEPITPLKKEESSVALIVAPAVVPVVELVNEVKSNTNTYTKNYTRVEIIEEEIELPSKAFNEENVILLSAEELKQRILGITEQHTENQKEHVRTLYKQSCSELLDKVKCYENPQPVDSDDEDVLPLSREELKCHVLHELENNSKKMNMNITEKAVKNYVQGMFKEKLKTLPLAPVKEESVQDVHPFLIEYGVNPIKTNTIMIDNRMYHKNNTEVAEVAEVAPIAPLMPTVPVVPVVPVAPIAHHNNNNNNKKNKRKKH